MKQIAVSKLNSKLLKKNVRKRKKCLSMERHVSAQGECVRSSQGYLFRETGATRRRVPHKWRQIRKNSLMIVCTLENYNIA